MLARASTLGESLRAALEVVVAGAPEVVMAAALEVVLAGALEVVIAAALEIVIAAALEVVVSAALEVEVSAALEVVVSTPVVSLAVVESPLEVWDAAGEVEVTVAPTLVPVLEGEGRGSVPVRVTPAAAQRASAVVTAFARSAPVQALTMQLLALLTKV